MAEGTPSRPGASSAWWQEKLNGGVSRPFALLHGIMRWLELPFLVVTFFFEINAEGYVESRVPGSHFGCEIRSYPPSLPLVFVLTM